MPPNLETFSAQDVVFDDENIDLSDCHRLTFLIYKEAGFTFDNTD